jgi:hypothetical protein
MELPKKNIEVIYIQNVSDSFSVLCCTFQVHFSLLPDLQNTWLLTSLLCFITLCGPEIFYSIEGQWFWMKGNF